MCYKLWVESADREMDRAVTISPVARWARAAGAALAVAWRSTLLRLTLWSRFSRHRFERRLEDAVELDGPIGSLAGILEVTDRGLYRHSLRVARHAAAIARGLGLSRDRVARIHAAAVLHDIGKMRTPPAILAKADPLTEREYLILKEHAETGAEMVTTLGDPELAGIVRHHHERIDGEGYPAGLAGEGIPIGARIVAVADVFDALTSERPYQAAMAPAEALALLEAEAGAQLDPRVVDLFRRYYGRQPAVASRPFATGHAGRLKFAAPLAAVPMAAAAIFVLAGGTAPSTAPTVASAPKATHVKPAPPHFVRGGAVPAPGPTGRSSVTTAFVALSPSDGSGSGDAVSIGQSPSSGASHGGAPQLETVEPGAAVAGATKPEPESKSEPASATEPVPAPVPAPATQPAPASVPAVVSVPPAASVPPAVSAGTVPEPPLVEEPESAPPPESESEPTAPPFPGSPATTVPPPPNQQDVPEQTEQSLGLPSSPAGEAADALVEEPSP